MISREENNTGELSHVIHAMDTFFSMVENYAKSISDAVNVEKITGSRLHLYIVDDISNAIEVLEKVSAFAYSLSYYLKSDIGKYKTLEKFEIQVGACYGKFYDYIFKANQFEEATTIGFAANFAAKLQTVAGIGDIAISSNIYESLDSERKTRFNVVISKEFSNKYSQNYYAITNISNIDINIDFSPNLAKAKDYANSINLGDIEYSDINRLLNFQYLSKTKCKRITGIPFFADVRGFTGLFNEDDSNLEEMANATTRILTKMYETINKSNGVHVQFQGDREMAIFHNYSNYSCEIDAVLAGLKLIDAIDDFSVSVGIGESLGTIFATKIGARGEKDNILLGETVSVADKNEDDKAGKNELIISNEIYNRIRISNRNLAKQFQKADGSSYRCNIGYKKFCEISSFYYLDKNNKQNNYNKAWCESIEK